MSNVKSQMSNIKELDLLLLHGIVVESFALFAEELHTTGVEDDFLYLRTGILYRHFLASHMFLGHLQNKGLGRIRDLYPVAVFEFCL